MEEYQKRSNWGDCTKAYSRLLVVFNAEELTTDVLKVLVLRMTSFKLVGRLVLFSICDVVLLTNLTATGKCWV